MYLYSSQNPQHQVGLKEAVLRGLAPDKGLYMPVDFPQLSDDFWQEFPQYSLSEMAFHICHNLFQGYIPEGILRQLLEKALHFDAPLVKLDEHSYILELFHGPTLAFKDFGASFMAQLMGYFTATEQKKRTILVATSGDTGGAVAAGFFKAKGIEVVILYPSGKVSVLQEKQLTTLGHNIRALEVEGTFDDCQSLVKQAFLDESLQEKIALSSANSINIARLIPQMFYYFQAYQQLLPFTDKKPVFVVPSGNFGNLTAGLFASKMGLPVSYFVAATNANDVVPQYLQHGIYQGRPSVSTISNAMDVGNPSNFDRIMALFKGNWQGVREAIKGYAFSDATTREAIQEVFQQYQYTIDPHGAVAYLAWKKDQKNGHQLPGILVETAHPAKFLPTMNEELPGIVDLPEKLKRLKERSKHSIQIPARYEALKEYLIQSL